MQKGGGALQLKLIMIKVMLYFSLTQNELNLQWYRFINKKYANHSLNCPLFYSIFQILVFIHLLRVQSVFGVVFQTFSDKLFCILADFEFLIFRKFYLYCLQNYTVLINFILSNSMSKRSFSVKQFIKDHSQRPDINLRRNLSAIHEGFRRKVPISSYSLWC